MFNRVILMGRLTKDPEIRTTQTGISMCRFSIAVDRKFAKQGESRQADFFDVTCFKQTADFVCKWFSKGKAILVEGNLQNNNYTDNNGVKHYSTAIVAENVTFCGDKSNNQNGNGYQQYQQNQGYQNNSYQQVPPQQNYQQGFQMPSPTPQQQQFAQQVQQFQQMQQPVQAPQPQAQPNQNVQLGDLNDFGEILSDGNVPF